MQGKPLTCVGGFEPEITGGRVEFAVDLGGEQLVDLVVGEGCVVHGARGL